MHRRIITIIATAVLALGATATSAAAAPAFDTGKHDNKIIKF